MIEKGYWKAHAKSVASVDYVGDHSMVLTSSTDCTVMLWSLDGVLVGMCGQTQKISSKKWWDVRHPSTYLGNIYSKLNHGSEPLRQHQQRTSTPAQAGTQREVEANHRSATSYRTTRQTEVTAMKVNVNNADLDNGKSSYYSDLRKLRSEMESLSVSYHAPASVSIFSGEGDKYGVDRGDTNHGGSDVNTKTCVDAKPMKKKMGRKETDRDPSIHQSGETKVKRCEGEVNGEEYHDDWHGCEGNDDNSINNEGGTAADSSKLQLPPQLAYLYEDLDFDVESGRRYYGPSSRKKNRRGNQQNQNKEDEDSPQRSYRFAGSHTNATSRATAHQYINRPRKRGRKSGSYKTGTGNSESSSSGGSSSGGSDANGIKSRGVAGMSSLHPLVRRARERLGIDSLKSLQYTGPRSSRTGRPMRVTRDLNDGKRKKNKEGRGSMKEKNVHDSGKGGGTSSRGKNIIKESDDD